jgi:hypothetical protein
VDCDDKPLWVEFGKKVWQEMLMPIRCSYKEEN